MKSVLKWMQVVMVSVIALMIVVPTKVQAEETIPVLADAAIVVDAETGQILYGQNDEAVLGIASMSKMMSEYLLFEAIEDKKTSSNLTQPHPTSPKNNTASPSLTHLPGQT